MPTTNNPDFWLALARGDAPASRFSGHSVDIELLLSLVGLSEQTDAGSISAAHAGTGQALDGRFLHDLAGLTEADPTTAEIAPLPADVPRDDEREQPVEGHVESEKSGDADELEASEEPATPHVAQSETTRPGIEQSPADLLLPDDHVEETIAGPGKLDDLATELAAALPEKPRRSALSAVLRSVFAVLAIVAALAVGFVARGFWNAPAKDNDSAPHPALQVGRQQAAEQLRDEEQLLSAITRAVGDPQAYRRELKAYAEQFPGTSRANDFEAVLASGSVIWDDVQQWNELVEKMAPRRLAELDAQGADELRKQIRLEQTRWASFPGADDLNSQLERLGCIAARRGVDGKTLQDTLTEQLRNPALRVPFVLQTIDGKRYYLPNRPIFENGKLKAEYLVDLDSTLRALEIAVEDVDKPNTGKLTHSALCERSITILQRLGDSNWERVFVELLATIKDEPDVDPVIRAYLLKLVLDAGCRGSLRLRTAFEGYRSIFDAIDLDLEGTWLAPDEPTALDRKKVVDMLRRLTVAHIAAVSSAWKSESGSAAASPRPLEWVGWCRRGQDGGWSCVPPTAAFRSVLVIPNTPPDQPRELVELNPPTSSTTQLLEGLPVFVPGEPGGDDDPS